MRVASGNGWIPFELMKNPWRSDADALAAENVTRESASLGHKFGLVIQRSRNSSDDSPKIPVRPTSWLTDSSYIFGSNP